MKKMKSSFKVQNLYFKGAKKVPGKCKKCTHIYICSNIYKNHSFKTKKGNNQ